MHARPYGVINIVLTVISICGCYKYALHPCRCELSLLDSRWWHHSHQSWHAPSCNCQPPLPCLWTGDKSFQTYPVLLLLPHLYPTLHYLASLHHAGQSAWVALLPLHCSLCCHCCQRHLVEGPHCLFVLLHAVFYPAHGLLNNVMLLFLLCIGAFGLISLSWVKGCVRTQFECVLLCVRAQTLICVNKIVFFCWNLLLYLFWVWKRPYLCIVKRKQGGRKRVTEKFLRHHNRA